MLKSGLHMLCQPASLAVRKWRENEKMKRKWRENEELEWRWRDNEEMERDSLSTFPHFLFISSLSIHSYIKTCLILSQNVKYSTFVANVTKKLNICAMRK